MGKKACTGCGETKPLDQFQRNSSSSDGRRGRCKVCQKNPKAANKAKAKRDAEAKRQAEAEAKLAEKAMRLAEERQRRLDSEFAPLKPEDFDVAVANDGRVDKSWSREKRQEYSENMGKTAHALHAAALASSEGDGSVLDNMPGDIGEYIGKLSEQERRFGNRRLARSISLAAAHEALAIDMFKQAAQKYLADKITPTGYARKKRNTKAKRTVCLLLSDLHLGSNLSSLDEPTPFRAVEEARRLEFIMRETIDYKPQYRENTELLLLINGDIIEGELLHDFRSGAPLAEQKVIFWHYFRTMIGFFAQNFPSVRIVCQPGNHGRDKVRHPGRATARKWDGHEWEMYYALAMMASGLKNVSWSIPRKAVSAIDLYGSILGMTHGDTEVKVVNPDTGAKKNAQVLDRINTTRIYGVEFDAWCFGHFHQPRYHPRDPHVIWNGALVPPNGYARSEGYIGEPCGQFLWEAVEGYPIGDLRFIKVDRRTDADENLGSLITPFRFSNDD